MKEQSSSLSFFCFYYSTFRGGRFSLSTLACVSVMRRRRLVCPFSITVVTFFVNTKWWEGTFKVGGELKIEKVENFNRQLTIQNLSNSIKKGCFLHPFLYLSIRISGRNCRKRAVATGRRPSPRSICTCLLEERHPTVAEHIRVQVRGRQPLMT